MKSIVCCIVFLVSQSAVKGQFDLSYGLNSYAVRICLGNCSGYVQQPTQLLHDYHDGGLGSDNSRPNFRLEESEVEDMLDDVSWNIQTRMRYLDQEYNSLRSTIGEHLPAANQEKVQIRTELNTLNNQIEATLALPQPSLNTQEQLRMKEYLHEIHSLKNSVQAEMQRTLEKRFLNEQSRQDLQTQRATLIDDATWHISDEAQLLGILASNINATSNLMYDLLSINPAVSNNPVISGVGLLKSTLEDALIKGQFNLEDIQKAFAQAALIDGFTAGNDLLTATNAFAELGKRVADMTDLPADQNALRLEIQQQLASIDAHLNQYETRIVELNTILDAQRYMLQMIDNYLKNNGVSADFEYIPFSSPPPNACIAPENPGFQFEQLNPRDRVYDPSLTSNQRSRQFELEKISSDYPQILQRFEDHTSIGQADPVFSSLLELQTNEHVARMCLEFSGRMQQDFEEIRSMYPGVSPDLIQQWMNAASGKRYEALNYLPVSNEDFRYTLVDLVNLKSEMNSVIDHIQATTPIPYFACNIYTATLVSTIYGKDITTFKNNNNEWLTANQIAVKAALGDGFSYIGTGDQQKALNDASYLATIGKPVVAVYFNPNPGEHGHINFVLPGLNQSRSSSWQLYVPSVSNYSLTLSGECTNCFTDGMLSNAFGADKAPKVIFYVVEE